VAPPVLPLFFVAAACFMVPLGLMRIMFSHGILDNDIACILPSVTTALKSWNGRDPPPESAYAALVADLRASREAETLVSAATPLNYGTPGFRSLLCTTDAGAAVDPGGEVRGQLKRNSKIRCRSAESDHLVLLAPNAGKLACSAPTG
jgi:hypothetical protein